MGEVVLVGLRVSLMFSLKGSVLERTAAEHLCEFVER